VYRPSGSRAPSQTMAEAASGGRSWWAHFEFTRINIAPIILKNKIEIARFERERVRPLRVRVV
jgi:hypothetical protein